jgi:hypothetical protein
MADRIDHNAPMAPDTPNVLFGGAAVIIPPNNGGKPVELLILDASSDPAQFWATVMTRIKLVVDEIETKSRQGFGAIR